MKNQLLISVVICAAIVLLLSPITVAQTPDNILSKAQDYLKGYTPPKPSNGPPSETPEQTWQQHYSKFSSIASVRYAASVTAYSSQYGTGLYSASQVVGPPNYYPSYGSSGLTWASATADGQREYLELLFADPAPVTSIGIYETYNPGAIDTIYVKNPNTTLWEVVWSGPAYFRGASPRLFIADFALTSYDVTEMRLAVNSPAVGGWNEIDAVSISSTPLTPMRVNTMPSYTTSTQYANALVGLPITVWGNETGGTSPFRYVLSYGDGTVDSGTVADPHFIGAAHTYSTAGPKTMSLIVRDALARMDSDKSVINVFPAPTQQIRVNIAIEKGLLYLYRNQYADGHWYDASRYVASTGMAVLSFEENGHLPQNNINSDIYAEFVRLGLDYLFSNATTYGIYPQPAGIPDIDGDGIGVYLSDNTYANGMGILGVIGAYSSGASAKTDTITVGAYNGQTFYDFVVDAIDQWAFSQSDYCFGRGGWRYSVNTPNTCDMDNSTTQWAALDFEAAEKSWGIAVPSFVKSELLIALQNTQNGNGGFGYQSNVQWLNITKTAAGIGDYAFLGYSTDSLPVQRAIAFIDSDWAFTAPDENNWSRHLNGNTYAMYGVAKGMRIINNRAGAQFIGTHEWYNEYVVHLLDNPTWKQNPDGSWPKSGYNPGASMGDPLNSSLAVLVLTQGVVISPPVAAIAPITSRPPNRSFTVDGSGSYHQDPTKSIIQWLWDWNASNGVNWNSPDATGPVPTNPGYPDTGTYTITLRVKDDSDPTLYSLKTAIVHIQTGNNKPVAVAIPPEQGPGYAGKVGQPILLDGRGSFDPDSGDAISAYNWDTNGDGNFGDASTDTVTVVFNDEYQGQVGLKVYDLHQDSSSNNAYITVVASRKDIFVEKFIASPYTVIPGGTLNVLAVFKNDDSSNTDVPSALVRFYDGNPFTTGSRVGGDFYVSLPVGGRDTVSGVVTVPGDITLGTHKLYAFLDANHQVAEWDERNNIDSAVVTIADSVDTRLYRTAKMEDWATAEDQKGKLKAVKCKPDKVDFSFALTVPAPGVGSSLSIDFSMIATGIVTNPITHDTLQAFNDKKTFVTFFPPLDSGKVVQVEGRGYKGKQMKVKYGWGSSKKQTLPESLFTMNTLRLPLPNLHNVGEDIAAQSGFPLTVGDTAGAGSVLLKKYKDALKSLNSKGTLHTGLPRCMSKFENGKPITKQQKGLPPGKHNNMLFAEALVLKLNVLGSDLGKFPSGLGELIYDAHNIDPSDPFNGDTVRSIVRLVDQYFACAGTPRGTDSTKYLNVVRNINAAFSDTLIDTVSWSCTKVVLKGVRTVQDVPYLRSNPGAVPATFFAQSPQVLAIPEAFSLQQNYPNPFNPTTTIQFELPDQAIVTLKVYNVLGQEVVTLLDHAVLEDGTQEVEFEAQNLPSGVYFYRIVAETITDQEEGITGKTFVSVKKMMLLK